MFYYLCPGYSLTHLKLDPVSVLWNVYKNWYKSSTQLSVSHSNHKTEEMLSFSTLRKGLVMCT